MSAGAVVWRVARVITGSIAAIVVFVVAWVGAVLLHLGSAPARRIVARELPALLDGAFPGTIRVHALGSLSVYGLSGVDIDLVHPDGALVAKLRGVQVTLDPVRAVKAFLGAGPIEIPIRSVRLEGLDIDVTTHDGQLRIADVFDDPDEPAMPVDPNARDIDVQVREIVVRHGWAHGVIDAGGLLIDADLDDIVASVALDATTTRVTLVHVDLTTRSAPRGADVRGEVSAAFSMTSAPTADTPAQSAFVVLNGEVARAPISLVGILRGEGLHAFLWLPEVTPEQLSGIAPEAPPFAAPASVTAVVDGTFDRLGARVLLAAAKSRIDVRADAVLAPSPSATAHVEATDIDAALVGGPASSVSFDADASAEMFEAGDPRGHVKLATQPGVVAGIPLPAVTGWGTFEGKRAHAELDVQEPGLRTAIVADMKPGPRGSLIDATIEVPEADLTALKRRGYQATGRAELSGKAHLDLGAETIVAWIKLSATSLSAALAPGISVSSLDFDARAEGAWKNPNIDAKAWVRGATVERRDIRWATVTVEGPAMRPLVVAEVASLDFPHVLARARVDIQGGPTLDDVEVEARRGTTTARLSVRQVIVGAGIPRLNDMRLMGLGEPLTMSVTPENRGGTRIVASAPRISIPAVAELAGFDVGVRNGRFRVDTDIVVRPSRFDGKIALDVQDVDLRREGIALDGIDLSARVEIQGRKVTFSFDSEATAIGYVHVKSTRVVELSGAATDVASWRDALGEVTVTSDVRLASIMRFVPREQVPILDAEGRLTVAGTVGRATKGDAPSLDLDVRTDELGLVGKPVVHGAKADPTPVPAWTLRGVDFVASGKATPDPARVELTVIARDTHGELVTVAVASDMAYGKLLNSDPVDMGWIETQPLSARASIPSRKIADLPPNLGIPKVVGNIVLDVKMDGTLREPNLSVDGALAQLSIEGSPLEQPFTLKLIAHYDGKEGDAHLALDQSTTRMMKATAKGRVSLHDLLQPQEGKPLPWIASADVKLGPLPLDVLEALIPTKIDGVATGHVVLEKLHEDASLDGDVSVAGLVLGGIPHKEARVKVTARDGKLTGNVRLAQSDGFLEADAKVGIAWGARIVPELRATEEFDVGVKAQRFRLRAVEPFATSVLNRLDGRLDGEVRLSKEVITDAQRGRGVRGKLALSDGRIEVAAGGGPLDDVRATVRIDEAGKVRLEDVFARGSTGELRAEGVATFGDAGFHAARLNVVIPQKEPMPLLLSGEHLADVSANVSVSADMMDGGRELRVGVDIPRLTVNLPDVLPDGVQKLDDIEHVRIGTMRGGNFVPLPVDAPDPVDEASGSTFRTRVNIGLKNARIVKGDMLSTYLSGNPRLLIDGDQTIMSGAIKLQGGRVDIKGRRFEIESGLITFNGEPANPDVLLTAKWEAPDDTTIYADFAGPLTTGKVTLRSDPPRSREEILALVIFGRVEGYNSGGQEADKGTQAVGMAGGFAAEGLNKVLDDVTDVEVRTRVDTSSSSNPRPELEVQISREIAARIAYVLGQLPPGTAPDKTYGTLDWSFRPQWSLETTVGDRASTSVDVIWERRY